MRGARLHDAHGRVLGGLLHHRAGSHARGTAVAHARPATLRHE